MENLSDRLGLPEEQAFQLSQAAIKLDQARDKDGDPALMVDALNQNLEIWVALRSIVMREDCALEPETKANIGRLGQYVAEKTFKSVDELPASVIDSLININLQISEGLLEGATSG